MKVYYCEELDDLLVLCGYNFLVSHNFDVSVGCMYHDIVIFQKKNNPMIQYRYEYIGEF